MKKGRINILKAFTIVYFIISFIEIVSEYLVNKPLILLFKPLIPLLIIVLYVLESNQKSKLFVFAMIFSIITNIFFIPNTAVFLFYAIVAFLIHRVLIVYLLASINPIKDFIPFLLATAPFLLVFFYLFIETENIPENSYAILILQNILMSIFAGIALSSYVMDDNKQNSILLISAFLFVLLQFVVFIEKYFLIYELKEIFRPMAMILNVFAFYTLYKYMIEVEKKLDDN
jgi:hypothetical protein